MVILLDDGGARQRESTSSPRAQVHKKPRASWVVARAKHLANGVMHYLHGIFIQRLRRSGGVYVFGQTSEGCDCECLTSFYLYTKI
jgi:hypothetical protein